MMMNYAIKKRLRRAFGKRPPPAPGNPKGKPGRPFVGARGGGPTKPMTKPPSRGWWLRVVVVRKLCLVLFELDYTYNSGTAKPKSYFRGSQTSEEEARGRQGREGAFSSVLRAPAPRLAPSHGTRFEIFFGGYGYVTTQDGTSRSELLRRLEVVRSAHSHCSIPSYPCRALG